MDAREQLQLLEYLVADVGHRVGWQVNYEPFQARVDQTSHFSIKLFESPRPKSGKKSISASAWIHPRLGCLDIEIRKRAFADAEIQRMNNVEAVPNSGFVRNHLRWRISQARGIVYDEAVYWLSVACRPSASCASCNPRNIPGK